MSGNSELKSYWQTTTHLEKLGTQAALPKHADVVIVGGGLTGLSTAYHLQSAGIDFVLLEKECLGCGASSRNAGLLLAGTSEHFARLVAAVSLPEAKMLWDFSIENNALLTDFIREHAIACDFRQEGSLSIASSEPEAQEIQESVRLLQENGYGSEWLDQAALKAVFGGTLPAPFLGARFYKNDATFNPAKFLFGLTKVILKRGGRLFPRTPVLRWEEKKGTLFLKTTAGVLSAHMVVLAANGYLSMVHPFFNQKIEPVRGQMIATKPTRKRLPPMGMLTNFGYEYWQQTPDKVVALGGMRWQAENADVGKLEAQPDPRLREVLTEFLKKTFAPWGPFAVAHNWAGIMGFSQDGLPFLGKLPGRNTVLVAGGFTGHGMAFGFLSGKILANIIHTGRPGRDITLFSPGRFL